MASGHAESGHLRVERTSDRDIKIRGLEVLLDGRPIGNVPYGKSVAVDLEPGEHRLKVTNTLYTKTADFTVAPGETVTYDAFNYISGLSGMMFAAIGIGPYKVALKRRE